MIRRVFNGHGFIRMRSRRHHFHFSDKFLDQELRKGGERLNGLELLGRAALQGAARGGEESLGGARQVAQERGFGILRPRVGRRAKNGFAHAFALGRQVNRDRSGCAFRMRPAENLRRNGLFRNEGLSCRVWEGLADAPKVSVLFGGGFVFRASRGARAGLLGFGDVPKSDRRGGVGRAGGLAGGGFGVERVGHGKLQKNKYHGRRLQCGAALKNALRSVDQINAHIIPRRGEGRKSLASSRFFLVEIVRRRRESPLREKKQQGARGFLVAAQSAYNRKTPIHRGRRLKSRGSQKRKMGRGPWRKNELQSFFRFYGAGRPDRDDVRHPAR